MAIRLYRSNRAEALAECLGDVVASPLAHPLAREVVAVQGTGMERWLSMTLARRFGVFANAEFPFPRALIERLLTAALGESQSALPFDSRGLGWAVADLVRVAPVTDPRLDPVTRYLERSDAPDAWLDLGLRLGEVFDRMLLYRPELTAAYEAGEHDDLRATLWRMLVDRHGHDHLAHRARRYLQLAAEGAPLFRHEPSFPARVSLFGISSLPPLFMRLLSALSTQREVHVFALTPTREFMGDLEKRTERNDMISLLDSVGRLSRDFQDLLESEVDYVEPAGDLFHDPGTTSLLAGLQSDLLHLHSRGPDAACPPLPLRTGDRSLRVHDCHSRTRELEVLRDQLLALFADHPGLKPRDVVVLAPDIEAYAPAIQAVFGAEHEDHGLPFRVADRDPGRSSGFAAAVLALLELLGSRMTLGDVADFLHRPWVHERFGLTASDVPQVVRWLEEAGARWGLSAAARQRHGQPDEAPGTLRFALQRMWLGHVMSGEEQPLFEGVLPFDDIEGQADRLEGLGSFVEALLTWEPHFAVPRPCHELSQDVDHAIEAFLQETPQAAGERKRVRDALAKLSGAAEDAGCVAPITLRSFRQALSAELSAQGHSHAFLQGGITFGRHVPMRALPFRVVCLLGMDDEGFPRRVPSATFDPVAEQPRRGDRTPADDDRQVFLEALLSARDHLIITHRGRGIEDNAVRPRAAVVDQLLDVIEAGWVPTDDAGTQSLFDPRQARKRVVQEHMLWPFDAAYFDRAKDAEWFSYDVLAARARTALATPRGRPRPFVDAPLPPRPTRSIVRLEELVRFFRHPTRDYLQRGLDVALPRDSEPLPDREPALLSGLDRYHVANYVRDDAAAERDQLARLAARSLVPLGDAGTLELRATREDVQRLLEAAQPEGVPERVRIDCDLGGVRVVGEVQGVYPDARCEVLVSAIRPKHRLAFWIEHVALCAQLPRAGLLVGRGKKPVHPYRPVADARARLRELVELYLRGRHVPLPLFADASEAFARSIAKGDGEALAMAQADRALNQQLGFTQRSAGDDAQLNQVYGLVSRRRVMESQVACLEPDEDFATLALRVFGPMLDAEEKPW